jgi:hypothetical protein
LRKPEIEEFVYAVKVCGLLRVRQFGNADDLPKNQ